MKKITLIIISLFIVTGCSFKNGMTNNEQKESNINQGNYDEVTKSMKATIDNQEYIINLEDNETVKSLVKELPMQLKMNDLNGNEKYVYLDISFETNPYNPKKITAGDVMLYGDNCLVIFYKSFDTTYSYTKIGHIDNLPNLGNDKITVILKK